MKTKIKFNPILMFIILIAITIILSGLLSFFNVQADYSTVNTVVNRVYKKRIVI